MRLPTPIRLVLHDAAAHATEARQLYRQAEEAVADGDAVGATMLRARAHVARGRARALRARVRHVADGVGS